MWMIKWECGQQMSRSEMGDTLENIKLNCRKLIFEYSLVDMTKVCMGTHKQTIAITLYKTIK